MQIKSQRSPYLSGSALTESITFYNNINSKLIMNETKTKKIKIKIK